MRRDSCRHLDLDLLARLDAGRALDSEHLAIDAHAEGLAGPDAGRVSAVRAEQGVVFRETAGGKGWPL